MTLPRPHILFDKPLKVSDPKTDVYLIKALWNNQGRVLVQHSGGFTDFEYVSEEIKLLLEEKVKEIK